jgi:hypothetical protein
MTVVIIALRLPGGSLAYYEHARVVFDRFIVETGRMDAVSPKASHGFMLREFNDWH